MKSTRPDTLEEVIYVSWEESESGWGTRPDGCSLHLDEQDFPSFERDYWKKMPNVTPDCYERPAGSPVPVRVTPELYEKIKESKKGIRLYSHQEDTQLKKGNLKYGRKRSGWVRGE